MGLLRNIIFKTFYLVGAGKFLLRGNRKNKRVPVLVFHKVNPERDQVWPGIHPERLEEIIQKLGRHYEFRPLCDLVTKRDEDLSKACFITFDDGYKDFLEYAYPVLKKYKVPATLFVLPYDLSNRGHIWTSLILNFVAQYPPSEVKRFFSKYIPEAANYQESDLFRLNLSITRQLCSLSQDKRQPVIEALQEKMKADGKQIQNELLSFDELRSLDTAIVSIASHSLTHPSFKQETDERFIEHELRDSKETLERELNVKVHAFAFPFANYNTYSLQVARQYYSMSFTGINDFVSLKNFDENPDYVYHLSRFSIHQDTAEEVFLLINGFHRLFK
jgi:peptidoglycan/xylan/chitin deacetylase (PgdA/CDA1 family)